MSTTPFQWNDFCYFVVRYSYTDRGRNITGSCVSYEQDPFDALMESYRSLLITYHDDFQMQIAEQVVFKKKA